MGLVEREPDAKVETDDRTFQVYVDDDKVTLTEGVKGGNGGYGGKREFPRD